ncbi:MAG: hypothetical protein AUH68_01760 [Gemmatimonadetes bacterium 13_1_40CM_4_69_5]|nr:MAG: hypothetical protein AUH68_01760 [Gemmatimonadetes bacterium 13_1_40CM_4_69_5]
MPLVRPFEAQAGAQWRRPARVNHHDRPGPAGVGLLDQHPADLRIRLARDERDVRLGDPGFLSRDPGECRPQVVGVLQRDLRHHAGERRDDVGRVQPPAQTDLDHGDVHTPRRQVREGDGGRRFEEARVKPLDLTLESLGPRRERLLAHRFAVDGDPLAYGHEVG